MSGGAVVYGFLASPPTRAVLLTAKLIGFELTLKFIDLPNGENRSESFLKLNPAHSLPTFVDSDGFTICDSHAIVTYLVGKYGKDDALYPTELKQRALVDNMLHFNNSGLWNSIRLHFIGTKIYGRPYNADNEALFRDRMGVLNTVLGQRTYAAGETLTVADLSLVNSVSAIKAIGSGEIENYPNIVRWLNKLENEVEFYHEIVTKGVKEMDEYVRTAPAIVKTRLGLK